MAIGENKNKSPYHGIWLAMTLMILVPIVFYLIIRWLVFTYQWKFSAEINEATAKTFGFGLGIVFHMACIIGGVLKEPFQAVTFRIKEFFSDLQFSFKFALRSYWHNIREGGVAFWLLFVVMAGNFALFLNGLLTCLELS